MTARGAAGSAAGLGLALALALAAVPPAEARLGGGRSYRSRSSSFSSGSSYGSGASYGYTGISGSSGPGTGRVPEIEQSTILGYMVVLPILTILGSVLIPALTSQVHPRMQAVVPAITPWQVDVLLCALGVALPAAALGVLPGPLVGAGGLLALVQRVRRGRLAPSRARAEPTLGSRLRDLDPCFSRVVFLDLVHALFHRFHAAVGDDAWEPLRPFLSRRVLSRVDRGRLGYGRSGAPDAVRDVVVGGIRVLDVTDRGGVQRVRVALRANLTEVCAGEAGVLYQEEEWTLSRAAGVRSPRPEVARVLGCPSCGATVALDPKGRCTYCDEPVVTGSFSWKLAERRVLRREPLPPLEPGRRGEEPGTDRPLVKDAAVASGYRVLRGRDPDFDYARFARYAMDVFLHLQSAWSQQDLGWLRGLETDRLYESHRFWIERYREAGIRNRIEEIEFESVGLSRIEVDGYYDSITLRFVVGMIDVTVDRAGEVLVGDGGEPHRFGEYWTFVRTRGAAGPHAGDVASCPACGAPRDRVGARGDCEYCGASLTGGEHDWVLALIQQDEEYTL